MVQGVSLRWVGCVKSVSLGPLGRGASPVWVTTVCPMRGGVGCVPLGVVTALVVGAIAAGVASGGNARGRRGR